MRRNEDNEDGEYKETMVQSQDAVCDDAVDPECRYIATEAPIHVGLRASLLSDGVKETLGGRTTSPLYT